jgi:hypothetical protein
VEGLEKEGGQETKVSEYLKRLGDFLDNDAEDRRPQPMPLPGPQ